MNHNLLISKYLDGDLSREEDTELRRLLSEDSAIKAEFDSATMLHIIMHEDAVAVLPPQEFILRTEELILRKYAESQAMYVLPENTTSTLSTRKFTSTVAVLLLLWVLPFGDIPFEKEGSYTENSSVSNLYIEGAIGSERSMVYSGRAVHHRTLKHSNLSNLNSIDKRERTPGNKESNFHFPDKTIYTFDRNSFNMNFTTSGSSFNAHSVIPEDKVLNKAVLVADDVILSTNRQEVPNEINNATSLLAYKFGIQPNFASFTQDQSNNTEIQVNTFVSSMISIPGDYTNTTASYSQSIAYSLGIENRVGMEVGYFGYSYQDGGTVLVPKSTSGIVTTKTLGMDDPAPGLEDAKAERASLSITNGYDEKKVEYSLEKNMYWGAAFYEHTLLNSGDISLNGRIGLGGSNDGPMAFSRAYARFNVYSGIALTFGAEANAFMIHAPMISGKEVDVTSGISLVYGMQIKF